MRTTRLTNDSHYSNSLNLSLQSRYFRRPAHAEESHLTLDQVDHLSKSKLISSPRELVCADIETLSLQPLAPTASSLPTNSRGAKKTSPYKSPSQPHLLDSAFRQWYPPYKYILLNPPYPPFYQPFLSMSCLQSAPLSLTVGLSSHCCSGSSR